MFGYPNQGRVAFTINPALQCRDLIGTGFCGAHSALSRFPCRRASRDYLIPRRSRMRLPISYLLMAFTGRGTLPREKAAFSFVT